MICPRCQTQLPDNSNACNRCGLMFQQPQQKKSVKKLIITLVSIIVGVIALSILIPLIISYIPKEVDYGDAESFEKALNDGVNVSGKVVKFKVSEYATPTVGYNLHAGEHLNFVSFRNPGCSKGDTYIAKVKRVHERENNIWEIWYKPIKNGKETKNTIYKDE